MVLPLKLIRECRLGPPKQFKSGAISGSYPKPMLYFQFDRGGIDVVPRKSEVIVKPDYIKMDVTYEDIVFAEPGTMAARLALGEAQPKITVFDYASLMPLELSLDYTPTKSMLAMEKFQMPGSGDWNVLAGYINQKKSLPWKTVVFDSATGYTAICLNHMSSFNPGMMSDARVWASQAGAKMRQLILAATGIPAHVVFIFHTVPPEADETTKQLQELPNIYSKLKADLGGLFSQYFYATKNGSKPVVKVMDYMFVKGLGQRWPQGLPPEVGPTFQDIYGKELS